MKNYELTLCGVKRILPFVDLENDLAFASFVIMIQSLLQPVHLNSQIKSVMQMLSSQQKQRELLWLMRSVKSLERMSLLWQERV